MTETPRTLDALKAIADPAEQARAAKLYLERVAEAKRGAEEVRREAIRKVLEDHGVSATAELCGVSVSLVKLARKG